MSRVRKSTALVCAAALLGGGGLTAAQAATGDGGPRPDRSARSGGPMSSASLTAIASSLGVTTAQLRAALDANRLAKPANGARGADAMATELAAALGVEVADVQEILTANRPAKPDQSVRGTSGARPPRGAKPSHTKLIAALASGLNLDTATVKAAFAKLEAARQAEHTARAAAMYAAIASDLGLSADAVKAAFEANRPARPTR